MSKGVKAKKLLLSYDDISVIARNPGAELVSQHGLPPKASTMCYGISTEKKVTHSTSQTKVTKLIQYDVNISSVYLLALVCLSFSLTVSVCLSVSISLSVCLPMYKIFFEKFKHHIVED